MMLSMSTHPASVVAFTELDEAFFRAGEDMSAEHEELEIPVVTRTRWQWLVLVPAVLIAVGFVVV